MQTDKSWVYNMGTPPWQLPTPISAIIFDCDGTLSAIEGIDELARANNVYHTVAALTADAMGTTGIHPRLYQERLDLVQPTREQLVTLGEKYIAYQTPDAKAVIHFFQQLNKAIYLLSAGLTPAVQMLGDHLAIPRTNIFSVGISFDKKGNYLDFDRQSPLVHNDGKRSIVLELKKLHANTVYVGDGLNDIVVRDLVTRFIGYGGSFYRQHIADKSDYYIRSRSLAALLPLTLTESEYQQLLPAIQTIYQRGVSEINLPNSK
jgi:phosphoserine phosphatase